jgi:hypothetical protein
MQVDVPGVVDGQGHDPLSRASHAQRVGDEVALVLHRGEDPRPAPVLQCPVPRVREVVGIQPAPAILLWGLVRAGRDCEKRGAAFRSLLRLQPPDGMAERGKDSEV